MNNISLLDLQINGQDCQDAQYVLHSCVHHEKIITETMWHLSERPQNATVDGLLAN